MLLAQFPKSACKKHSVTGSVKPNTLFQILNQRYFCWTLQHVGHTKQCFRTISTTVMLLLLHTWKKPTQDTVTTWGEKQQLKRPRLTGCNYNCPGAQETGKNLSLNTFLLRHLSTYFSVLSHLKETGYRLWGRIWTSNSSICLSQVKIEAG